MGYNHDKGGEKVNLSEKLTKLKTENGLTTEMLAALSGVPKGTINKILNGETQNPTARTLGQLAKALGCAPGALYVGGGAAYELRENALPAYDGILPTFRRPIPFLASVAAGEPVYDKERPELCAPAGEPIRCDFALRVRGGSMIGARIFDGDIVFIRKQPDVDDGQIACVVADDEVSLKRVYHVRDGLTLVAENPDFPPMVFTGADRRSIRILGRAVGFQGRL